jgi:hypothetical protein
MTQQQGNKAFQGPEVNMAFRYGNTLKTIYFVCFYAYLIPHLVVVGFVAVFI